VAPDNERSARVRVWLAFCNVAYVGVAIGLLLVRRSSLEGEDRLLPFALIVAVLLLVISVENARLWRRPTPPPEPGWAAQRGLSSSRYARYRSMQLPVCAGAWAIDLAVICHVVLSPGAGAAAAFLLGVVAFVCGCLCISIWISGKPESLVPPSRRGLAAERLSD
jgi:hypothetical protein